MQRTELLSLGVYWKPQWFFFSALRSIILFFFVDFMLNHFDSSSSPLPLHSCACGCLLKFLSCESSLFSFSVHLFALLNTCLWYSFWYVSLQLYFTCEDVAYLDIISTFKINILCNSLAQVAYYLLLFAKFMTKNGLSGMWFSI